MLVSVAAYPLWLHWKRVGDWLATQFVDYEPGIHWSQVQMQSGTTGINTLRVYNPIKQAKDHDPTGAFVRHWLPALRKLPDEWIFEPWKLPANLQAEYGFKVGDCDATSKVFDWPMPVVDLEVATKGAKAAMYGRRGLDAVRAEKTRVLKKHGSRKIPQHTKATDLQSTLDL
jgi:deoxyribodipyrimidine photo-lyase